MGEVFYGSESPEGDLFRERKEHSYRLPLPGVSSSTAKKTQKFQEQHSPTLHKL